MQYISSFVVEYAGDIQYYEYCRKMENLIVRALETGPKSKAADLSSSVVAITNTFYKSHNVHKYCFHPSTYIKHYNVFSPFFFSFILKEIDIT